MKKISLFVLIFALILCFSAQVFAKGPTDPRELEAFLDGVMEAHLKKFNVPGATLSVVKDGKIFFKKGYGYSDIDKRLPVDPDRTLFYIGSISKLFTWTAVMQMAEKGKLDLNADVNSYLKGFKIPETYPAPITLINLLTHTPGFEDTILGFTVEKESDLTSLEDALKYRIPARVFPPGELSSYSNYGTALAGRLVEIASGYTFDEYAEKNIFKPLRMKNTTFRQKYSPETVKNISKGYVYKNGRYEIEETFVLTLYPAGSVISTAADMATFMIAHLNDGRCGNVQILKPATARKMRKPLFGPDPRMNKMCYGFYETNMNGENIIGHGGDISGFHSLLSILPEHDLGLFVSYNSVGGSKAREDLLRIFMDHYFPDPLAVAPKAGEDIRKLKAGIEGSYLINRRPYTSFEKIQYINMPIANMAIKVEKDGRVLIGDKLWAEKEPLFFVEFYGKEFSSVHRTDGVERYFISYPFISFEKLAWYETPRFQIAVYALCILLFLSALVSWPVIALINLRKNIKNPMPQVLARGISCVVCLIFVLAPVMIYLMIGEAVFRPVIIVPYLITLLGGVILTLGAAIFTGLAWKGGYWSLWSRVHYSLVTLAMLVFIWWLNFWNLLGFRF